MHLLVYVCLSFLLAATLKAEPLERIIFGSCSHQDKAMPILDSVIADHPDLFIFLGDNVYGDTEDMQELAAKYEKLGNKPRFQALRASTDTVAIWDDHDFGENDAGIEYPQKESSRQVMLDFWQEPKDSQRRTRKDGIYAAYTYGEPGQRVQVILPDLRWNRPPLSQVSKLTYLTERRPLDMGPYIIHPDINASMLGEKQWQWIEEQLQQTADIRIIGSSLQVLTDFTGWEAWANFPADIQRLKGIIKKHRVNGIMLLSGDTHWGEISYLAEGLDYPLWDITSSGLTQEWKAVSPNKNRLGSYTAKVNYGVIDIDWQAEDPLIKVSLRNVDGQHVLGMETHLSALSPY